MVYMVYSKDTSLKKAKKEAFESPLSAWGCVGGVYTDAESFSPALAGMKCFKDSWGA